MYLVMQSSQFCIDACLDYRRCQVVNDDRITPAFGLGTFTHIVHDIWINDRCLGYHYRWIVISP